MPLSKTHTAFLISGMRRRLRVALCVLVVVAIPFAFAQRAGKMPTEKVPKQLRKAIGCLVASPLVREYGLKPLRLKAGDWAWVRYHVGSIPGLSETPGEFYVAVYDAKGTHGELLMAIPNQQGGFDAVTNGYSLTKHDSHWTASEGNGGYEVYDAIGRFVTHLARHPRYYVHLVPGDSECTSDGE